MAIKFHNSIDVTEDITLSGRIKSLTDVVIRVDSNNDTTNSMFEVENGGGSYLFRVYENGNADFTGTITNGTWNGTAIASAYIAGDAITGAKIADDAVDSEHYTDGSIDTAHIGDLQVTTAKIAADAITGAKIADDAIDIEHYVDGSIDHVHLAADAVDGDNIADDSINSEHYVDGSIDTAHIADNQVTYAKMQNVSATSRVLGRITSGAGDPEELTGANIRTIANVADGSTANSAASDAETIAGTDTAKFVTPHSLFEAYRDVTAATESPSNTFSCPLSSGANFSITLNNATNTINIQHDSGNVGTSGTIVVTNPSSVGSFAVADIQADASTSEALTPDGATLVWPTGADDVSLIAYYVAAADKVLINFIGNYSS